MCRELSSHLYNLRACLKPSGHPKCLWTLATIVQVLANQLLLLQGKELLSPGKNAMYNDEHKIVTPMNVSSFTAYPHVQRLLLLL